MEKIDTAIKVGLLIVSFGLSVWGLLGLVEYGVPTIQLSLQNENFPAGLQFLHFFSILVTGSLFTIGYLRRWRHTPYATITMYAVLASICFIETMDFGAFGGGAVGVTIMSLEFTLYFCLSLYLLNSPGIRAHFQHP